MMRDFDLEPFDSRDPRLRFSWNIETGEIAGPGADFVRERIQGPSDGFVPCHPVPYCHKLSKDPLRSLTDMAALLGYNYKLPPDLQKHYPRPAPGPKLGPNMVY